MSPAAAPALHCPTCGAPLERSPGEVHCSRGHAFAERFGVLDFRGELVGFDREGDERMAAELDAMAEAPFEDLLRRYWERHPDVDPALAERFVRGDLIGEERGREVLGQIEDLRGEPVAPTSTVLEVGSGTAALGVAVARRAGHVVVSDVSLAWLVLARRRIEAGGLKNMTVIAATGDRLPFQEGTFDLVVAADVIEHVPDATALILACHRVLKRGGALWVSTPNRYSLTPEPHVRVLGVGWLPRPLGRRLVQRRRGLIYDIDTLSLLSLRRALSRSGGRVVVTAPPIAGVVQSGYPQLSRLLIAAYHTVRRLPLLRHLLLLVTPLFHGLVVKDA